jgi:hypothetical protein
MFLSKDIYKALRPEKADTFSGWKFKKMSTIDYNNALVYPRFKFLYGNKPHRESGIFETSDYKTLLNIVGDRGLVVGGHFAYNNKNYEITLISIDILDIVIDYSNGHTDYYVGKPIPFHIEIEVLVRDTNLFEIAIEFAKKYTDIKEKGNLNYNDLALLEINKMEAENCFNKILNSNKNNTDIYRIYGMFKSDCDENENAIKLFKAGLELDSNNADLHFNIGYEYNLINNKDLALKHLGIAANLGSNEAQKYLNDNFLK